MEGADTIYYPKQDHLERLKMLSQAISITGPQMCFCGCPHFLQSKDSFFSFFLKLFSVDSGLTHSVANLTFLLRFTLGHLNHNIGRESLSLVLQICFFLVISTHVNGPIIHLPFIKPGFIFDFSFLCPPNLTHQQVLLTLLSS